MLKLQFRTRSGKQLKLNYTKHEVHDIKKLHIKNCDLDQNSTLIVFCLKTTGAHDANMLSQTLTHKGFKNSHNQYLKISELFD